MGKKVKDIPTATLISYQQILGESNKLMDDFATGVENMVNDKALDQGFLDTIMDKLGPKVNKNSDYIDEIDKELIERIQFDMPGCVTGKIMGSWYNKLREAQVAFAKSKEQPEEKPEEKPVFKINKRKKG